MTCGIGSLPSVLPRVPRHIPRILKARSDVSVSPPSGRSDEKQYR
ncbi:MAG: hypothetical protein HSCHL_1048 [Hydrogenibacillus schlegelii]|uniref:Uncharacterized protein n=1 Tax=Hydrogenibacillus schlegelii TaxID=1484 RepID=A0A2T5G6M7_HYDSH|nr:MAG: hypothetical protein HSCHL_1048 [Hydrogenibacillus schlegelii]